MALKAGSACCIKLKDKYLTIVIHILPILTVYTGRIYLSKINLKNEMIQHYNDH